jgi:nucleoside-diphosphate-sugar epimerase
MIYFILGGSGFIGSRLCERLKVDFRIVDKVSPPKAFVDRFSFADVRDFNSLHSVLSKNASIVNLAAEHRDDVYPRSLYDEVNVQGAKNLCEVARQKNIQKIIFTRYMFFYFFYFTFFYFTLFATVERLLNGC